MRASALLALALSAVALAGCGDGGGDGAGQVRLGDGTRISLDLPEEQRPDPDDIRGAVSGVVVDSAIFPVAGATVSVRGRDLEATADGDGRFAFEAMPPGIYTLLVRAEGHGDGLGTVSVRSGQVAKAILQVHRVPALDPYHTTLKFDVLHDPLDILLSGHSTQVVAFDLPPQTVVLEAAWSGLTDPAVTDLIEYEVWPETDPSASERGGGGNPLRAQFDADFFPPGEYAVRFSVHPSFLSSPTESRGEAFLTVFYVEPAPDGWSLAEGDT